MKFKNDEHESNFKKLMAENNVHEKDLERKALFYLLSSQEKLMEMMPQLYDSENEGIKTILHPDGQEEFPDLPLSYAEKLLIKSAYNLFNGFQDSDTDILNVISNFDDKNRDIFFNALDIRFSRSDDHLQIDNVIVEKREVSANTLSESTKENLYDMMDLIDKLASTRLFAISQEKVDQFKDALHELVSARERLIQSEKTISSEMNDPTKISKAQKNEKQKDFMDMWLDFYKNYGKQDQGKAAMDDFKKYKMKRGTEMETVHGKATVLEYYNSSDTAILMTDDGFFLAEGMKDELNQGQIDFKHSTYFADLPTLYQRISDEPSPSYEEIKQRLSGYIYSNYEGYAKAIISLEKGIDDPQILDEAFKKFMEDDDLQMLSSDIDDLLSSKDRRIAPEIDAIFNEINKELVSKNKEVTEEIKLLKKQRDESIKSTQTKKYDMEH